ncbi:MAG: hypothetical protein ACYDCC_09455 [Actinomycetota bacterium]
MAESIRSRHRTLASYLAASLVTALAFGFVIGLPGIANATSTGVISAWGGNANGQLGNGSAVSVSTVPVPQRSLRSHRMGAARTPLAAQRYPERTASLDRTDRSVAPHRLR